MREQPGFQAEGCSNPDEYEPKERPGGQKNPTEASEGGCAPKQRNEKHEKQEKNEDSNGRVKQINNGVGDGGRGISVQIRGTESEANQTTG
jgi:hypothetical protein